MCVCVCVCVYTEITRQTCRPKDGMTFAFMYVVIVEIHVAPSALYLAISYYQLLVYIPGRILLCEKYRLTFSTAILLSVLHNTYRISLISDISVLLNSSYIIIITATFELWD